MIININKNLQNILIGKLKLKKEKFRNIKFKNNKEKKLN